MFFFVDASYWWQQFLFKKGYTSKDNSAMHWKNYIFALYNYNACTIIFVLIILFQVKSVKMLYFCPLCVDIEKERKAYVETQIVHLNRKENFALKIVSVVFASFGFCFVEFWVSSARFPKSWNRFLWFQGVYVFMVLWLFHIVKVLNSWQRFIKNWIKRQGYMNR